MQKVAKLAGFLTILFIISCVTVNVYFPAAEVQKAADKIVEDVRAKGNNGQKESKPGPSQDPSGRLDWLRLFKLGPGQAYAAMNIDISTPAIRGIRESMKNRFPQLKPFYDRGALGENNNGFVAARDTAGLSLQERSRVNTLIDQENRDRAALYSEIATANKLGPESVPQIEKIFANSWRDKSQPGWWVQDENGAWRKK
jgi:uncharacterized protein